MERITISLPEDLVKRIKRISKESGLKVSRIVAMALREHLGTSAPAPAEAPVHPTVLWKIKGRQYLRGPSPTLRRAKIGSWRIVDLSGIPL